MLIGWLVGGLAGWLLWLVFEVGSPSRSPDQPSAIGSLLAGVDESVD